MAYWLIKHGLASLQMFSRQLDNTALTRIDRYILFLSALLRNIDDRNFNV